MESTTYLIKWGVEPRGEILSIMTAALGVGEVAAFKGPGNPPLPTEQRSITKSTNTLQQRAVGVVFLPQDSCVSSL